MNVDDAAGVCFLIPTYSLHKLPNINKTGKIFTYTRMLAAGATQAAPAQAPHISNILFSIFCFVYCLSFVLSSRATWYCQDRARWYSRDRKDRTCNILSPTLTVCPKKMNIQTLLRVFQVYYLEYDPFVVPIQNPRLTLNKTGQ